MEILLRPAERNRRSRANNFCPWPKMATMNFICGRRFVGRSRFASALVSLSALTVSMVCVIKFSRTPGFQDSFSSKMPSTESVRHSFDLPAPPSWRNLLRSLHPASFSSKPNSSSQENDNQMFDQVMQDLVAVGDEKWKLSNQNRKKGRTTTLVGYASEESDKVFKNLTVKFCEKLVPPKGVDINSGDSSRWQHPNQTNLYLYSAYYDPRLVKKPFVRIIGMMKGLAKPEKKYFCQLWFDRVQPEDQEKDNASEDNVDDAPSNDLRRPIAVHVPALIKEIWWGHWDSRPDERKYRPYLISCPVPHLNSSGNITSTIPATVSITTAECGPPSTFLPVTNKFSNGSASGQNYYPTKTDDGKKSHQNHTFVVCVKGLDFLSDNTEQLLEWLEMQKLLGASHVMAHIFRLHPETRKALALYEEEGFLTLVPFTLPGQQPNDPNKRAAFLRGHLWQKRRNELVPYNDCFYRYMAAADFVVPLDVDELILPRSGTTWSDIVDGATAANPSVLDDYASLAVQNVYFFKNATTHPNADIPEFLPMTRQDQRSANFSQLGRSVKSFVSTSKALTVFNHYALHPLSSRVKAQYWVPTELAQMNHYRTTCPMAMRRSCMNDWFKFTVKDDIMLKYRSKLEEAVRDKLIKLGRIT